MTAEQLEELLQRRENGEIWQKMKADLQLDEIAPSLARRVLAAEKLVEALSDAVDAWDDHNKYGDMMQGHWVLDARDALTAYREASKGAKPQ